MDEKIFIYLLLLGLITFVSLIISGLAFITEPLFQNDNIVLSNPNLGITKMAIVMSWLSLPITIFMSIQILLKIVKNSISIGILGLGLLLLFAFILYGLSILSMGVFQQNGVYIKNIDKFLSSLTKKPTPTPAPTPTPTPIPTPHIHVYTDTFTINCLKMATIFSWLSISWNIFFFIKATSDF